MTRAAWAWAAATGVILVAGVGCYHPAPYAPNYGYPTSPGIPGAYPAAPGGSYVVPGGSTLGAPSTTYPSGPGPTLAPPINGSSPGGNAPPYTYEQNPPSNGNVPNYTDPNAGDFGNNPGGVPSDGFLPSDGNGANASPFYPSSSAVARPSGVELAAASRSKPRPDYLAGIEDYDPSFQKVKPAGFEESPKATSDFGADPAIASTSQEVTVRQQSPDDEGFGYDHSQYRWLRGVVDYDPVHKDWHIIYGLAPESADKFGGSLTLAENGQLKELQNDDVVLVEGRPDPQAGRDVLGKPYYRVTRAELLGRFE
jgi:hypothetical protein